MFLLEFNPIKPDIGLIFWTTLIFLLFWTIVGKFAFRPIANALKKREVDIQTSLDQAKVAREEMANLQAENEKLLAEAREERARIIRDSKEAGDRIVQESKQRAKEEAQKIVASARNEIESQKKQALLDVKNQVGMMALDIAGQVLRRELSDDQKQVDFVGKLVREIKLN